MRNIFKLLFPCLFAVVALSGCYDEMDSKFSIDNKYEGDNKPAASLTSASVITFSSLEVSGAVDAKGNTVLEMGVMLSTSDDFATYNSYAAKETGATFSFPITGLNDNTTYYIRSYAVSAANGTAVSDVQKVTTPIAPIFELGGAYTAKQYEIDSKTGAATLDVTYEVTVAFEEGSATKVKITNLFGGEMTVSGTFDAAKSTFTVEKGAIIANDSKFGEVFINPVNNEINSFIEKATFTFQTKGGFLDSSIWAASVSAGNLGFYKLQMTHN